MNAVDRLIVTAEAEIGYLEKKSNGWHQVRYKDQEACVSGKYGKLVA